MARVHLLNRTQIPGFISCGKMVSRPHQYTTEVKKADCPDCADAHPGLTYEERNEVLENAEAKGRCCVPGCGPVAARAYRKYPEPWEACDCKSMESRSWDRWFSNGGAKPLKKSTDTVHAPERHGGCGPNPETVKKQAERAEKKAAREAAKTQRRSAASARAPF